MREIGYSGEIWPVHPRAAEIAGLSRLSALADCRPRLTPRSSVSIAMTDRIAGELSAARRRRRRRVRFWICEAGEEGNELQTRCVDAAAGMPFLGPNGYGFINDFDRALVWPDQHGGAAVPRGVAIITQSGNIGMNLTMQRRALPIGYLITLGNRLRSASAGDRGMARDARVSAIGLHIEGLSDPQAFARRSPRAAARKGVVALKTGRSERRRPIAQSTRRRSAAWTGGQRVFRAASASRESRLSPTLIEAPNCCTCRGRCRAGLPASAARAEKRLDRRSRQRRWPRPGTR